VDTATERCQQHEPPVAQLVPEPLDHDPAVGRQGADDLAFVLEVREQILGCELVEVVVGPQSVGRRLAPAGASVEVVLDLRTKPPSARPSSIGRPEASPCQNGSLPGTPGAGETVTRSWPISSIRHELAPSVMTSPARLS
jgi:hypothetical protein